MPMIEKYLSVSRTRLSLSVAALLVVMSTAIVCAQAPAPAGTEAPAKKTPTAQTHPNNPEMWNVDAMMEEAVVQIARRYNLNTAQENYTRLLLTKRTRAFLDTYEADVRELLKESIDLKLGTKPASVEGYIKWATRAAPIYKEASKAILDGNEEWRSILNEDQKKIHDGDLSLMRTQFDSVSQTMEKWKTGETPLGRGAGAPPKAGATDDSGLGTAKPAIKSQLSPNPAIVLRQLPEDSWLAYVNLFIDAYKLDEKQTVAAREKIHKEMRDQAVKYREKRKAEFDEVEKDSRGAAKSGAGDLTAKRAALNRPLHEMFIDLDRRLDQLLDTKQRAAVNVDKKKLLDNNFEALAGKTREEVAKSEALESVKRSIEKATSQASGENEKRPAPVEPKPASTAPAKD